MDNIISDIQEIIIHYLDGTATLEEKNILLQWLKSSDENRENFVGIRDLWLSCDVAMGNEMEVDMALKRFRSRISLQALKSKPLTMNVLLKWKQIAAVIIVLLSIGYSVYTHNIMSHAIQPITVQNQLIAAAGSKGRFVLPDSSVVWLNSGSRLTYHEPFGKDHREVTLEGEAYFQVRENKRKPFIVNAHEINIEVLGTSFNISNYPEFSTVEVVLLSGSIKANISSTGEETILVPDQLLTYYKETGTKEVETTPSKYYIDWTKDRLVFDNECLSDIIISLEGWYSVQIDCPKAFTMKSRMSFTLRNENIEEILKAMSLIIPIKYTIKGSNVRIIPK